MELGRTHPWLSRTLLTRQALSEYPHGGGPLMHRTQAYMHVAGWKLVVVVHRTHVRALARERRGVAVRVQPAAWSDHMTGAISRRNRLRGFEKLGVRVVGYHDLERLRIPTSVKVPDEAREALRMIDDDPIAGAPLFEPLKGLWSRREGELRIVYRIVAEAMYILILAIA